MGTFFAIIFGNLFVVSLQIYWPSQRPVLTELSCLLCFRYKGNDGNEPRLYFVYLLNVSMSNASIVVVNYFIKFQSFNSLYVKFVLPRCYYPKKRGGERKKEKSGGKWYRKTACVLGLVKFSLWSRFMMTILFKILFFMWFNVVVKKRIIGQYCQITRFCIVQPWYHVYSWLVMSNSMTIGVSLLHIRHVVDIALGLSNPNKVLTARLHLQVYKFLLRLMKTRLSFH